MNKIAAISLSWVLAITASIAVVKLTAIGPVILTISASRGMGVHTFDLITIVPMTAALVFTVFMMKKSF